LWWSNAAPRRGTIFASSQPGSGTSFRVLRRAGHSKRKTEDETEVAVDRWSGSGNILVIDDEAGIRRLARLLLEEEGFEVDLAADGDEALERIGSGSDIPDLLLLDLTMPRRGGIEVLEEIRRQHTAVPVVLMSGFTESEVASVLESDPRAFFLQKPFTSVSLQRVVRRALATARAASH
jgi:CheY-like chemotaxis protein